MPRNPLPLGLALFFYVFADSLDDAAWIICNLRIDKVYGVHTVRIKRSAAMRVFVAILFIVFHAVETDK